MGVINEFFSHYYAPGGMCAGFEYYRAFPQDAIENQNYSKAKLTMPVLAVGGEYYPAFAGNVTSNSALYAMKTLAQNERVTNLTSEFPIQVIGWQESLIL